MTCIQTGAYVELIDYGLFAPADIYRVENALLVRFNGDPEEIGLRYAARPVTHQLDLNGRPNFWRPDLGLAVVAASDLRRINDTERANCRD